MDAGIKVIAGYDLDERCRATYEHNNPGATFVHTDINSLNSEDIFQYLYENPVYSAN